ncbi:MAG TPA: endonuclease/exonuclease/phosphatase family protein [Candidatus Thermoplasmatota archaeon]|nr:endonuclease/exonuclease/phosphatase family protein [Candidatus Thermoplasmatota archaeon]
MGTLRLVTWNILHQAPSEEEVEHPWRERRDAARRVLESLAPDIFCAQEAYPEQMDDLLENMPHHWWIGWDRDGGDRGEGCPIAYDTRRLTRVDEGQFWLSPLPDVPSSLTWVNDVPRIVTWARFIDIETGARFRVANAHLDHLVPSSRTKTVALLKERLGESEMDEPTLVVGDFNSPAWAKPHRMLTREPTRFYDALRLAEERRPRYAGTFHHFRGRGLVRLDWVLARPAVRVLRYRVVRDAPEGILPSDHFPVCVDLALPFEAPPKRKFFRAATAST